MDKDAIIERLDECIKDLDLDYARMSLSGQATYDEICELMELLKEK